MPSKLKSMKEDKTTREEADIHDCFKWIYRFLFVLGCADLLDIKSCPTTPTESTRIFRYFCIFMLFVVRLLIIGMFYGSFYMKLTNKEASEAFFISLMPVLRFILAFESLCSSITYIEVCFAFHMHKRDYVLLMQRIKKTDKDLTALFPRIRWNVQKSVKKYTPIAVFLFFFGVTISAVYVFSLTKCQCEFTSSVMLAVSYGFITVTPPLVQTLHVASIDFIRIRFRLIRNLVKESNMETFGVLKNPMKVVKLIELFKVYTGLIEDVNKTFSFVAVASAFHDFTILTNMIFVLCQKATEEFASAFEFLFLSLIIVPRFYKTMTVAAYGYFTKMEGNKTFQTLQSLGGDMDSFRYWRSLSQYELRIGGTIPCNLGYIYLILNSIGNYVIILIQLQLQQNSIQNQGINHNSLDIKKNF